jgi:hypothetical protein
MTMKNAIVLSAVSIVLLTPRLASAHCDTLDGPVVKTAQKALATGKVGPVLAWVQAKDEAEIKAAFDETLAVRKLGAEAKALADRYFFETLVRVHRAGEGAPYTGLKPAGSVQEPALALADKAIDTGKLEPVAKLLADAVRTGLHERVAHLRAQKAPGDDVAKGRQWVAAYVAYVHYVVGAHQAAAGKTGEHEEPAEVHARE